MLEFSLYQYLNSQTEITNIVGTMIFPLVIPQAKKNFTPTYPAITFNLIDDVPIYDLSGYVGMTRARVQIDYWSDVSNKAVVNLADVVRLKLQSYRGDMSGTNVSNCRLIDSHTTYQPPIDGSDNWIYRKQSDYMFSYFL
tara:strand:+ start:2072 stop:2491 length:420 start_codon:yes stop_codon:yes gene_type:complete